MPKSVLCLLGILLGTATATPALTAPAMWEVRDEDSAIWLFGSFHVLPEGLDWRTPLFDRTLAAADKVVFEVDVRPAAMAKIGAEAFVRGIYTDGTLLTDILDTQDENKLREVVGMLDIPAGSLLAMKPWFAANTISLGAMSAQGYSSEGVESLLQPLLPDDQQIFLESGDQQLDVLAGAPEAEQLEMLRTTLDEIGAMPKMVDKMVSNWIGGTPENLTDLFLSEMGGFEGAFLERLIYARNRDWIGPLENMLAENQEALVIVGAAHLAGDRSVLDLLEEAGYQLERVQ